MFKILRIWFIKIFFRNRILLENILIELRNIHFHLDNIDKNKIEMKKEEIKEDKK